MKYDISNSIAPAMPTLRKGTECIKILLTQVSKDMREPLVPMLFPILGAHVSGTEFQYPDLTWKELCGMMANLVAESGGNKGKLSGLVEAISRNLRNHDETETKKQAAASLIMKNVFVKPEAQNDACISYALVRKGRMKSKE